MLKTRIIWLDNLKFFLIILVVLGHTIQFTSINAKDYLIFNYLHSFHVPLFMLASGFSSCISKRKGLDLIVRRFNQLLVPYFLWSLLWYSIFRQTNFVGIITHPELYLWFAWALFFISTIHVFSILFSAKIKFNEDLVSLIIVVLFMAVLSVIKIHIFALNLIGLHFFFYMSGVIMYRYMRFWDGINVFLLIILGALSLNLSFTFIFGELPIWVPIKNYMIYMIIVGIIAAIFYLPLFRKLFCQESFLTKVGEKYTLSIYFIHLTLIKITTVIFTFEFIDELHYFFFVLLSWVTLTTISIVIAKYLLKFSLLSKLFLGV